MMISLAWYIGIRCEYLPWESGKVIREDWTWNTGTVPLLSKMKNDDPLNVGHYPAAVLRHSISIDLPIDLV